MSNKSDLTWALPQSFPTLLFCFHSLFCRSFSGLFFILKIKSSNKENGKELKISIVELVPYRFGSCLGGWKIRLTSFVWLIQNRYLTSHVPCSRWMPQQLSILENVTLVKLVVKTKMSKSEENKKGTSQGGSHNRSTENAFTAAMSMPEA